LWERIKVRGNLLSLSSGWMIKSKIPPQATLNVKRVGSDKSDPYKKL
jgi:hypothetical protein